MKIIALVAQWLEQGTHNPLVAGSNPAGRTKLYNNRERSPIGRDNGLKIRPVWVRVPSLLPKL